LKKIRRSGHKKCEAPRNYCKDFNWDSREVVGFIAKEIGLIKDATQVMLGTEPENRPTLSEPSMSAA